MVGFVPTGGLTLRLPFELRLRVGRCVPGGCGRLAWGEGVIILLERGLLFVCEIGFLATADGGWGCGSTVAFLGTGGEGLAGMRLPEIGFFKYFFLDKISSPLLPEWACPSPPFTPPLPSPPLTCTRFPRGGECTPFKSCESAAIALSFPEVSISDVSLENGAVERSDSNLRLTQHSSFEGPGTRKSVSLVSFESSIRLSSEFDCSLSLLAGPSNIEAGL